MSDKLYSIKETTLTNIGDALRRKHGEKSFKPLETKISKTGNANGFNDYDLEKSPNAQLEVIKFDDAEKIKLKMQFYMQLDNGYQNLYVVSGEYTIDDFPKDTAIKYITSSSKPPVIVELEFENTNAITIYYQKTVSLGYDAFYYAEVTGLKETENIYTSEEMAQGIDDIIVGEVLPDGALELTGQSNYRFAYNGWNWFIDKFKDKITTKDLGIIANMFYYSDKLEEIPFDLNVVDMYISFSNIFENCYKLKKVPYIIPKSPIKPPTSSYSGQITLNSIFSNCQSLREIPDDFFNRFITEEFRDVSVSTGGGDRQSMFNCCYSLRKLPDLSRVHSGSTSSYNNFYYNTINKCCALDEVTNFPVIKKTYTSNMFPATANNYGTNGRIKRFTFETNEDGTPIVVEWKSQIVRFDNGDSYGITGVIKDNTYKTYLLNNNSGITEDKEVTDDASYQTLKNNPDWWTRDLAYSRYNHDSAVETINSLPDSSAYGTNTIVFRGVAGEKTDGGAINTLTAEEIAIATAKGWTVTIN